MTACTASNQTKLCPQAPEAEWVDGLPPVGCECEYRPDPHNDEWHRCAYLAHFNGEHFVLVLDVGEVDRMPDRTPASIRFRPIPTKAQRDRDDLAALIGNKAEYISDELCGEVVDADSLAEAILSRYNLEEKQ